MESDFTGFVLAGGKSSRMGKDKFSLQIESETFLTRAVSALAGVCPTVKIVLNQTQTIETTLPVVRDIYPERGANGAIHAAFSNCETKFAVVLAVDLPLVDRQAIENLARFALAANKFPAVVPTQTDGKPQPLCAVYRAKYCLPPLEKLLTENSAASVRDFLALIAPKYIAAERLSENENLLFNVNYPEDFQMLI
jgi:molybdopterin-guanine dinucleotide biosynthesis protein A